MEIKTRRVEVQPGVDVAESVAAGVRPARHPQEVPDIAGDVADGEDRVRLVDFDRRTQQRRIVHRTVDQHRVFVIGHVPDVPQQIVWSREEDIFTGEVGGVLVSEVVQELARLRSWSYDLSQALIYLRQIGAYGRVEDNPELRRVYV